MAHTGVRRGQKALLVRPALGLWLALALTVTFALVAWPFTVDDAFITARYAQRIASGRGFTFNDGVPSDGVTGPLWLLPMLIGAWLQIDLPLMAKLAGLGCCVCSLLAVVRRARARALGGATSLGALVLLCSSSALWIWSIAGLETGAACLAATLMLLGATRSHPAPLPVGMAGAALTWLRPELAPLVLLSLALLLMRAPRLARVPAVLVVSSAAVLLLLRLHLFGQPLPLSAYAKPPLLQHGVGYVIDSLCAPAALVMLPALLCGAWRGGREERTLAFALFVHGCAVLLAGGDWMASARLFVPVIPVACYLAARGLVLLGLRLPRSALIAIVVLGSLRGYAMAHDLSRARAAGQLRQRRVPELLSALAPLRPPIAILDVGAVGYLGGYPLIDLGGLTEPTIAHSPGGHLGKRIDARWLAKRAPGAIVLHSSARPRVDEQRRLRWFSGYPVERNVLAMRWVLERYRVRNVIAYDRKYFYVVLVPD